MPLLTGLTTSIISYIRPSNRPATPSASSPAASNPSASRHDSAYDSRSMSPGTKMHYWMSSASRPSTKRKASMELGNDQQAKRLQTRHHVRQDAPVDADAVMAAVDRMELDHEETDLESDAASDSASLSSSQPSAQQDSEDDEQNDAGADVSALFSQDADEEPDWNTVTKQALSNVQDLSGLDASVLHQTWPEATLTVLDRISNRGHEPLLPAAWKWDFRFLPDILFTSVANDRHAFINALSPNKKTLATKALADLFRMAARARDAEVAGQPPERAITQHISRFHTWAMLDAGLIQTRRKVRKLPRMVITVTGTRDESPQDLTNSMRAKFAKLERRWLEIPASGGGFHNRPLPAFYGFMISHSVVALWSYEPVDRSIGMLQPRATVAGTGPLRSVALFQTGQKGYDVWNALIVAIVIIQARNEMVRLTHEGVLLAPPNDGDSDPDPDA